MGLQGKQSLRTVIGMVGVDASRFVAKAGPMRLQLTFDAHDPRALAEFWAAALGHMTNDRGPVTHTLSDPEGNEFCVH